MEIDNSKKCNNIHSKKSFVPVELDPLMLLGTLFPHGMPLVNMVIVQDGYVSNIYGQGLLGYRVFDDYQAMLPDALGSFRQTMQTRVTEPNASHLLSTTTYDPYGNVILQAGVNDG